MRVVVRPIRIIFLVCCFITAYNWFGGWGLALLMFSHFDLQMRERRDTPLP